MNRKKRKKKKENIQNKVKQNHSVSSNQDPFHIEDQLQMQLSFHMAQLLRYLIDDILNKINLQEDLLLQFERNVSEHQ